MKSVFGQWQIQWKALSREERLQVRAMAVLAGWFIQFVVGGVTLYVARQMHFLRYLYDVMEGSPVTSMTPTVGWLFVSMAWLFTLWGAFRCTKLAGKRVFGSILVFWLGVEVFALPFSLSSGLSLELIWGFLGAGMMSLLGFLLALHHTSNQMTSSAPVSAV